MSTFVITICRILALYLVYLCVGGALTAILAPKQLNNLSKAKIHPAILGFCVVQLVFFYKNLYFAQLEIGTVVIAALLAALVVWLKVRSLFVAFVTAILKVSSNDAPILFASAAIFIYAWRSLLGPKHSLIAAAWNADLVSYAQISQNLQENGFKGPGSIVGVNAGLFARETVPGVFSSLVSNAEILRTSIELVLLPSLGLCLLFLAIGTHRVLTRFIKIPSFCILLSVFAQTIPIFGYLGREYFLSQVQASFLLVTALGIVVTSDDIGGRHQFRTSELTGLSLVFATLYLTYPQYVVVLTGFLVFIISKVKKPLETIKRALAIFASLVVGSILIFPNLRIAFDRTFLLASDNVSGWSMPWMTPNRLLGFQWDLFSSPSIFEIEMSVLLTLLFAYSIASRWKKTSNHGIWTLTLCFISLTYIVMIVKFGKSSYVQFKWISELVPIFIIAVVCSFAAWFNSALNVRKKRLGNLIIAILLIGNVVRSTSYDRSQYANRGIASSDMIDLKELTAFTNLNIKSGAYQDSMWPAFFSKSPNKAILDQAYFASIEPLTGPTLVGHEFDSYEWVLRLPINDSYDLIEYATGINSTQKTGLKISIVAESQSIYSLGKPVELRLNIQNIGNSTWLGSGQCTGCVNLAYRVLDINKSNNDAAWNRFELKTFPNYVGPGDQVAVTVPISIAESGRYVVEVTAVSENVAWFNEFDESNLFDFEVEVK